MTDKELKEYMSKFAYMRYTAQGKSFDKFQISKGQVFGVRPSQTQGKFEILLLSDVQRPIKVDQDTALFLMDRSKANRKVPDIGIEDIDRNPAKQNFSADRYRAIGAVTESDGIRGFNYQWRTTSAQVAVRTLRGREVFSIGSELGLRFITPRTGGVVVDKNGLVLRVNTEEYDKLVKNTQLIPVTEWTDFYIDPATIEQNLKDRILAGRQSERDSDEAIELQRKADELAARKQRLEEQRQADKEQAERDSKFEDASAAIEELRRKELGYQAESDEIEAEEAELKERAADLEGSIDYTPDEEVSTQDAAAFDLGAILANRPISAPVYDILQSLEDLDNPEHDESDGAFDLTEVEKTLDEESEFSEEESEEEDLEDEDDWEDDEDDEDDWEDDEDDEDDDLDEEEFDEDEDDEEDAEEELDEDEDAEEGDDDTEDDEADAEEESEEDEDSDEELEEEDLKPEPQEIPEEKPITLKLGEDPETDEEKRTQAIRYATNDKNKDSSGQAEEGDILRFDADKNSVRDFVILQVSSHKKSADIVVYTLYDITGAPDELRTVTINQGRGHSIFDYAQHVGDMKPMQFVRLYDMTQDYSVNKKPIQS